jgi:hypothetical protein
MVVQIRMYEKSPSSSGSDLSVGSAHILITMPDLELKNTGEVNSVNLTLTDNTHVRYRPWPHIQAAHNEADMIRDLNLIVHTQKSPTSPIKTTY